MLIVKFLQILYINKEKKNYHVLRYFNRAKNKHLRSEKDVESA